MRGAAGRHYGCGSSSEVTVNCIPPAALFLVVCRSPICRWDEQHRTHQPTDRSGTPHIPTDSQWSMLPQSTLTGCPMFDQVFVKERTHEPVSRTLSFPDDKKRSKAADSSPQKPQSYWNALRVSYSASVTSSCLFRRYRRVFTKASCSPALPEQPLPALALWVLPPRRCKKLRVCLWL